PNIFNYQTINSYMMPVYNPDGSFGWANPNWLVPSASSNNLAAVYSLNGYDLTHNDFLNFHLSGTQKLDDFVKGLAVKADVSYSYGNTSSRQLKREAGQIPTYRYDPTDASYAPK